MSSYREISHWFVDSFNADQGDLAHGSGPSAAVIEVCLYLSGNDPNEFTREEWEDFACGGIEGDNLSLEEKQQSDLCKRMDEKFPLVSRYINETCFTDNLTDLEWFRENIFSVKKQ